MILLGSIERTELQAVFDWWLSPERRVFERGQRSPGQGSKVSWESFTFVDEEGGEESADKVEETHPHLSGVILTFKTYQALTDCVKLPQTAAPAQEECNGPIPSPKPQEPSTNHTGSGNSPWPPHNDRSCHQMSLTSPLTHVTFSFLRKSQAAICQEDPSETLLVHLLVRTG